MKGLIEAEVWRERTRAEHAIAEPYILEMCRIYASSPRTIRINPAKDGVFGPMGEWPEVIYPAETEKRVAEVRKMLEEAIKAYQLSKAYADLEEFRKEMFEFSPWPGFREP